MEEGGDSAKIKLDYIDVPVLARFSSPVATGTSFHVFAGPAFGFRVSAKAESSFDGEDENEDIDEDVERFDFGVVAGAGLEFGRFLVDGRYAWGLSNINKVEPDDVKIKNRVFSVMVGIRF